MRLKYKRSVPEVNAGSMADIAFLLLIFFLVTASIDYDSGLNRMLSNDKEERIIDIKHRNLFEISINANNSIMVEGEIIHLKELRQLTISFLDNGGLDKSQAGFCQYCQGIQSPSLSENPNKAIISLTSNRQSTYEFYISVQNEIVGAYNFLRNREGKKLFGISYEALVEKYNDIESTIVEKSRYRANIEMLRSMYPQKIIEPENIFNQNKN